MAVSAITLFGCASGENSANADVGEIADDPIVTTETEELANQTQEAVSDFFVDVDDTESYDVLTLTRMDPNLSIFAELVELAGLDATFGLTPPGAVENYTVFVPTNEAFNKMSADELEQLRNPDNQVLLVEFIQRHVLPNGVPKIQFQENQIIETAGGENEIPVEVEMNGNVVWVGGAQIIESDVEASNGYIHVVNDIVEPSEFTNVTPE